MRILSAESHLLLAVRVSTYGTTKCPWNSQIDLEKLWIEYKRLEMLVSTYTDQGDLVLDNATGSGTLNVACVNLNRNSIGIEKDEKYYSIARQRVEAAYLKKNAYLKKIQPTD